MGQETVTLIKTCLLNATIGRIHASAAFEAIWVIGLSHDAMNVLFSVYSFQRTAEFFLNLRTEERITDHKNKCGPDLMGTLVESGPASRKPELCPNGLINNWFLLMKQLVDALVNKSLICCFQVRGRLSVIQRVVAGPSLVCPNCSDINGKCFLKQHYVFFSTF